MTAFLIALIVFALAGIASTALLRRRPGTGTRLAQGLAHLAELRWREFTRLVLQAMQARGYRVLKDDDSPGDELPSDGGDILLERDGKRMLLLCKYGTASVVGAQAILGLGKAAELRGAHGAMVVTPGRFDDEARRVAGQQHVELVDGASLWPEVEPFVEQGRISEASPAPDPRRVALAWLGAAAVAALTWVILQGLPFATAMPDATVSRDSPMPVNGKPSEGAGARIAAPAAVVPAEAVPTDAAILTRRRNETANAISTLAGVDRAVWSTQSTLLVYLASEDVDPSARLCPLLERYVELAASRVQLQPPQGSVRPVRFKQCRSY